MPPISLPILFLVLFVVGAYGFALRTVTRITTRQTQRASLSILGNEPQFRIGHGYDIHRLVKGNKLVIGGVYIPYETGADAHSDGDAVYHRY